MVDPIDILRRSHSLIRYSQIRQRYVRTVSPAIYVDIICGRLEEIEVFFFQLMEHRERNSACFALLFL